MIPPARSSFFNLHTHGFVRVAVGVPAVRIADPAFNAARTLDMVKEVAAQASSLVLFPELGLSGYAIDDLLHQSTLLDAVERAVADLCVATRELAPLILLGRRCGQVTGSTTPRSPSIAARSSLPFRRPICPTTANFMRSAISRAAAACPYRRGCGWPGRRHPSARTSCLSRK